MHGEGTLYQKDGSYYKGAFASGQMSGHGKQVTIVSGVETESFEGSFLRGQRHNEGLDHRVGKSDTRLWYNHGRLLRRQVNRTCLSTATTLSALGRCCADFHTITRSSSQFQRHRGQVNLQAPASGSPYFTRKTTALLHSSFSFHPTVADCPHPFFRRHSLAIQPPDTPRSTFIASPTSRPLQRTSARRSPTSAPRPVPGAACWWFSTCRLWKYRAGPRLDSTFARTTTGEKHRRRRFFIWRMFFVFL